MSKNRKKSKHYTPKKQDRMREASLKMIHDKIKKDLPYIYSAIALATWNLVDGDEEEKHDAVVDLINMSSVIWNEVLENGKDIVEECERITGIDIRKSVE